MFKTDDMIHGETINKYSFGIRGSFPEMNSVYAQSFSSELSLIEGDKYVILERKIEGIRYFDSLDVYVYERKNWKKSGRLGSLMIRDILFE